MDGRSWGSRALFSGALSVASAFVYFGCSDDPAPEAAGDAGADVSIDPQDSAPPSDGGVTDAPEVCPDTPVDCSATAGDAGVDDAGPGSVSKDAFENSVPISLRCTNLYSCWSTKKIATATHREYAPGFILWSDASEKTRWVVLPPGSKIDTSSGAGVGSTDGGTVDEWIFPVGTMVYKEFKLAGKRIETRRIWKASDTKWVYSVWRWSDDESTATLTYAGGLIPNGALPNHVYEIPATSMCANCHDGHRDKFLSLDAWSLATPATKGVTLAQLVAEGTIATWPHPTSFAVPQDVTGKFDQAVGFYYNNCGFCHKPGRPGAASGLELHLPVAAALPGGSAGLPTGLPDGGAGLLPQNTPVYLTAVDVPHTNAVGAMFPLGGPFKRITKGNADLSVLPARDGLRDPDGGVVVNGQMPNVLQRSFDPAGVPATRAWINALPP